MEDRMERAATCAFTGHRPATLPWGDNEADPRCVALKEKLDNEVLEAYRAGCRRFICGMAQGADFYFGEAVIDLRKEHPEIILEAAIPFPGQSQRWSRADRARYQRLLTRCDVETLIQQEYSPTCMHRRNRYMVDHACRLIAVYNGAGQSSGTLWTIHYAIRENLEIVLLEV